MTTSNHIINWVIGILLIIGTLIVLIKNSTLPNITHANWFIIAPSITLITTLSISLILSIWRHNKKVSRQSFLKMLVKQGIVCILAYGILYALFGNTLHLFALIVILFNALNFINTSSYATDDLDSKELFSLFTFVSFLIIPLSGMACIIFYTITRTEFINPISVSSILIPINLFYSLMDLILLGGCICQILVTKVTSL